MIQLSSIRQDPPNGGLSGLTDLLFSVLFGATFAFKLSALQMPPYRLNPSSSMLQYLGFFAYSITFALVYWQLLRIDAIPVGKWWSKLISPTVIILTIIESLAPYPAFEFALWIDTLTRGVVWISPSEVPMILSLLVVEVAVAVATGVRRFVRKPIVR